MTLQLKAKTKMGIKYLIYVCWSHNTSIASQLKTNTMMRMQYLMYICWSHNTSIALQLKANTRLRMQYLMYIHLTVTCQHGILIQISLYDNHSCIKGLVSLIISLCAIPSKTLKNKITKSKNLLVTLYIIFKGFVYSLQTLFMKCNLCQT